MAGRAQPAVAGLVRARRPAWAEAGKALAGDAVGVRPVPCAAARARADVRRRFPSGVGVGWLGVGLGEADERSGGY